MVLVELNPISRGPLGRPGSTGARGVGEAGVSLIEALISVGLLFIIAMGILPLFSRAIISNATGADSTALTNHSRHILEDAAGSPFDQPGWQIDPGSTVRLRDEVWVGDRTELAPDMPNTSGRWYPLATAPDRGKRWHRRTQVWQFGTGQWGANTFFDPTAAYDGSIAQDYVQLKLIEVDVRSFTTVANEGDVLTERISTMLGGQRPMRLRYIKSF